MTLEQLKKAIKTISKTYTELEEFGILQQNAACKNDRRQRF